MKQYKLVFAGPVASGKTTAVQTLCGESFVSTEEKASDAVSLLKESTTVAMDYGIFMFGDNKKLHIYGAPGQIRFEFMWEILSSGCLGIIILFNVSILSPEDIVEFIENYKKHMKNCPFVIGLTHIDLISSSKLTACVSFIQTLGVDLESIKTVDVRDRQQVAQLVEIVLRKIK